MSDKTAPLVFLHGDFGDGMETWGDVVAALGNRVQTVILDRPGFGGGASPQAERYTIAGDAAAAVAAIEALSTGPVHLVAHSYGGLVAIVVAATRSDLVRSLHLIEPPMLALLQNDAAAQAMTDESRRIQERFDQQEADAATAAFFTMIGAGRAVERLRGTPEWERLTRHAARFARSEPAADFPVSLLDRLPPDLPIVLYTGGRSHPALRGIVTRLAERLPQAQVHDIPDATHTVQRSGEAFLTPLLAAIAKTEGR
ncbi:MAG: alpha/beta fold hydrolase [Thermomicrobiales bacterium]